MSRLDDEIRKWRRGLEAGGRFSRRELAELEDHLRAHAADERARDATPETALAHGADEPREPMDYGFMYARVFTDPDGHIWEPFWLDLEAALAAGPVDVDGEGAT